MDDRLLKGEGAVLGERADKLLTARLVAITVVVPEGRSRNCVADLRSNSISITATSASCRYHPDAGWLKEHGYSEALAKCVHIPERGAVSLAI